MLTFFPSPYPDEWWYSILCRYYVMSGITQHIEVKRQLFGSGGSYMGSLFPNGTIAKVLSQLPAGIYSAKRMILDHTPFLYYMRMYPMQERQDALEKLIRGETITITHIWKGTQRASWSPRYCPVCYQQDKEKYGEPYWHTDHQIPLMSVCPKHNCRLVQLDIDKPYPALNERFFPLSAVQPEQPSPGKAWEEEVSQAVYSYWKLPLGIGPLGHNNLAQMLANHGFRIIYKHGDVSLDPNGLYQSLCSRYGTEQVRQTFGTGMNAEMVHRMIHWEQLLPDRYILLQVMAGMSTDAVFSPNPIGDDLKIKIQKLASEGGLHTETQIAKLLGIRDFELRTLMRHYELEPFWLPDRKKKCQTARTKAIHCTVSADELTEIEQMSGELGYRCVGPFVLDCVRYVMNQKKKQ